ncbi:MAG TPA: ribonuclease HII [Candidatus Cybelea sp.]|nr:ribonuclease HII [Candidatus Cybelea sp.]
MGPTYAFERRLGGVVCGIDEVGRGPLAGPVVAAAVILDPARVPSGINDSKALPKAKREILEIEIRANARVALGSASVEEIDRLNILWASMLAMRRAFDGLGQTADHALIDGNRAPELPCAAHPLVDGDARCLSIAAASIVAKVARDRLMAELALAHPEYGWERNAGYGTAEHLAALARLGPTPHHRTSFAPVRACLAAAG